MGASELIKLAKTVRLITSIFIYRIAFAFMSVMSEAESDSKSSTSCETSLEAGSE
jgi:hypothetical protein